MIKNFRNFLNENKIKESVGNFDTEYTNIASQVEKGFTSGEEPVEWSLDVDLKKWISISDEDVDYIATQIRNGDSEGIEPIEWALIFKDNDVTEEEEITKKDIANQLGFDESDFEDSKDLGDMTDSMINNSIDYDMVLYDVNELFDSYIENNDTSRFFNPVLNKNFEYDKKESLFKNIMKYYQYFEEEYGVLDYYDTDLFKTLLKYKIEDFLNR